MSFNNDKEKYYVALRNGIIMGLITFVTQLMVNGGLPTPQVWYASSLAFALVLLTEFANQFGLLERLKTESERMGNKGTGSFFFKNRWL